MIKIKDLRTTYNVLEELDVSVPREILVHIADRIRQKEIEQYERKMNRLSDDELIKLESKKKRTLRINTPDGRLFQKNTNEETFRAIMLEPDLKQVLEMMLRIKSKPLLLFDLSRKRIKGYVPLKDGYFLIAKSTASEKIKVLTQIDEQQRLNWEILVL